MTREEEIYNQLVELFSAVDKQPKNFEVVFNKRQLNIAKEVEKRYLSRSLHQYYSAEDLAKAFRDSAEWSNKNPNPQNIAEYLYKEKGYLISLNGEIPTFEETMKDVQTYNDYKAKQWLEKQSEQESSQINEQKPTNKIEPKFKVGDWVVDNCGYVWKIEGILNQFYLLEGIEVDESRPTIDWVDNTFHLWTIKDAKDGDVLAAHECYVVFKEIDGLNIKCYCTYHYLGLNLSFYRDTLQNKDAFLPATKEQHDAMMKAINDAGYAIL